MELPLCHFRESEDVNAHWIEAYFHGFFPEGSYKDGIMVGAIVVATNPDTDPTGFSRPRRIRNLKLLRFDEPQLTTND